MFRAVNKEDVNNLVRCTACGVVLHKPSIIKHHTRFIDGSSYTITECSICKIPVIEEVK